MNPALARAEKKLNKQINKQVTTITYSNNNYQRLVIKHSKIKCKQYVGQTNKQTKHSLTHTHTHTRARARARMQAHTHRHTHTERVCAHSL